MQRRQGVPSPVGADSSILVQRMVFDFLLKVNKMHDGAFYARGQNCLDAWHLLQIAVDPAYEGKGEAHRLAALSHRGISCLQ